MADKFLVEIEEIVNASGAEQARDKIVAALRGIATEAQQIASQAGGPAGEVAGQQSAEAELTRFRQGLEQQARGRQGGQGQLSQRQLRDIFTRTMGTTGALPPELQQFIRQAQYLSQNQIRNAPAGSNLGLGTTGKGTFIPVAPPGGGAPGNAERAEEIQAVKDRSQRLQNLAIGGEWAKQKAQEVRDGYLLHAQTLEELATTGTYSALKARASRAQAEINASTQEDLATTGEYSSAQARAARAKAEISAATQEELASTGEYAASQAAAARAKQTITARTQEELASDTRYAEATARVAAARDRIATQTAQAQLAPENLTANVERQLAEGRLRTQRELGVNNSLLAEPGQFTIQQQAAARSAAEAVARQRDIILEQNRMEEGNLAASDRLRRLKEQRATAEKGIAVGVLQRPDEDQEAYAARVRAGEAQRTLERRGLDVGVTPADGENRAQLAARVKLAEQNQAIEQRTAELRAINADENGIRTQIVEQRVLERQNTQLIEQQVRQRRIQDAGGQILPGGGAFQRLQAMFKARQTGDVVDPTALMGLGQFVGSRIVTTAGFALSGAAIYGVVRGIHSMVEEADQLNLAMSQVKAQMDSLGQGDQFSGFRAGILSISRDTGTAGKDVAQIGLLMRGAFGDNNTALQNTRATVEAMKVTGLEGADAINTFIALSKTFGESVQDISDKALGLQDRFGVMAKEIIQGAAAIAPVASQVGLSFDQLAALVAASAQVTGRQAGQVAEGFGRILPELQKNTGPILQLFAQVPKLTPDLGKVTQEFASGNEGQVLIDLIHHWNDLTKAQQNNFLALLGGPRNAQVLADALQNQGKLVRELDGDYNDGGRTAKGYADFHATLTATLARLRVELSQLGDSLARMGALDSLKLLAGGLEGVLKVLGFLTRLMADFNDLMHGIPGRIIGLVVAFKLLESAITAARAAQAAMNEVQAAGGVTGLAQRIVGGAAQAEVATAEVAAGEVVTPSGLILPAGVAAPAAAEAAGGSRLAGLVGVGGGGFLSRLGAKQILGESVTGLGGAGVTEGGLFAAGSSSLGAATFGLGIADTYAIQLALHERGRLSQEEKDASKLNQDTFSGMSLAELQDVRRAGIYQQGTGRGEGYALPQQIGLGIVTGGLANLPGFKKALPSEESFSDFLGGRIGIGDFIKGHTQAQKQQTAATTAATISEFDSAAAAGLLTGSGMTEKQIKDLQKRVDAGKDQKKAQDILDDARKKNMGAYNTLIASVHSTKQIRDQAAAGEITNQVKTIQDLQESLAAGDISYPQAIAQMNQQVAELKRGDDGSPELKTQIRQAIKAVQDAEQQSITGQLALAQAIAQGTGQDPSQAALNALKEHVLGLPNSVNKLLPPEDQVKADPNLNVDQRLQFAQQAYQAQQASFQYAIAHASSPEEAQRIAAAGQKIDPQVRAALEQAYYDKWHTKLDLPDITISDDDAAKLAADVLAAQVSAIHAQYAGNRNPAAAATEAARVAAKQLEAANALPGTDPHKQEKIDAANIAAAAAQNQAEDVDTANRQAAHALTQARANRDPVAIAADRLKQARENLTEAKKGRGDAAVSDAQRQVEEAQQAADDANTDIARARIQLTRAQHPQDAIAQARAAQDEADLAAKTAHGQAAELAAQAQRVAADRQMQDAIQAVADSRVKLLQAQMQVAGDDIGAAEQGVKLAQSALDAARARGDGEEVTNQLQANLEQAKGQLRDTTISSREEVIQFNLDMKRITIGQAIEQLNALLSIANPKEQMDIMRRIKQLRDQATQDLQFNIPQDIKLPTLYEVNRTLQTPTGQGYNDNRVVSVTMHINNGMDQAAATRWLSSTVGQAPRVVTGSRRL